jgi:hypothetical protein
MKLWQIKHLSFPQVLQFVKGIYKTKCYQEPLVSFIEVGQFGCFDASINMQDRAREYELKGSIRFMMLQEELESS